MEYFHFEWEVLKKAYFDTAKFVKAHLVMEGSVALATFVVGLLIYPDDPWLHGFILASAALLLIALVIGIYNLSVTPYRIWREQKASLTKKAIHVNEGRQRRTGKVTELTKVFFEPGIKYLTVKPYGKGNIKITVHDAPSDFVAKCWLEPDVSLEEDLLNCKIYAGGEEKFGLTSPIKNVYLIGDPTIDDVEIYGFEEWPMANSEVPKNP